MRTTHATKTSNVLAGRDIQLGVYVEQDLYKRAVCR